MGGIVRKLEYESHADKSINMVAMQNSLLAQPSLLCGHIVIHLVISNILVTPTP